MSVSKSKSANTGTESGSGGGVLVPARQAFMGAVQGAFTAMLGKLDDALFELAQSAEGDLDRGNYFDAIRELRLSRETIENRFVTDLQACWQALERGDERAGRQTYAGDRNEVIAFTAAVRRAETECADALRAVREGVAQSVGIADGDEILGPRQVFAAFEAACRDTPADPAVRLIVLKFFERHVGIALPGIYRALAVDLTASSEARGQLQATASDQPTRNVEPRLMSQVGADAGRGDMDLSGLIQRALTGGDPGQGAEALKLLATLQQHDQPGSRSRSASIDLERVTTRPVDRSTSEQSQQSQQMALDMVALLFDSVFSDGAVPVSARLQIARLQIPFLRLALRDRAVLARRSHLGRRFFDQLIAVTRTWQEPLSSPQQEVLAALIDGVGESCMDDHRAFAVATENGLADLRALAIPLSKPSDEGQSHRRALAARVDAELAERLRKTGRLPDRIEVFLRSHWRQYLLECLERYGAEASPWRQALASVDALLWSLLPRDGAARQRLAELRPRLERQLRQGMDQVGVSMFEQEAFLETLDELYARVQAGQSLWDWQEESAIESFIAADTPISVSAPAVGLGAAPVSPDASTAGQVLVETQDRLESLDDSVTEVDLEESALLELPPATGGEVLEADADVPAIEVETVEIQVDAKDPDESGNGAPEQDSDADRQASADPTRDVPAHGAQAGTPSRETDRAAEADTSSLQALLRRRGLKATTQVEEVVITDRGGRR